MTLLNMRKVWRATWIATIFGVVALCFKQDAAHAFTVAFGAAYTALGWTP